MNKKGFMSIFSMLIMFFIIILAVSVLYFQSNPNATINDIGDKFNWRYMNDSENSSNIVVVVTYKFINFLGDTTFIIAKEVSKWAYYNQNIIHPQLLLWLLVLFLLLPLIYPLFIIFVSLILIFKEWRQIKKEKRLLLSMETNILNGKHRKHNNKQ